METGSYVRLACLAIVLVAFVAFTADHAHSQEKKRYVCSADIVTGLAFNDVKKRWESSIFKPEQKFVLDLSRIRVEGDKDPTEKYLIMVRDFGGKGSPIPCMSLEGKLLITLNNGAFQCDNTLATYHVSLRAGRFLEVIPWGYWGGIDNNENNPVMIAGRCIKFE